MTSFGLITEGITDQIVLENILIGFFDNKDLQIDSLQPLRDETNENKAGNSGNWHKVLEYCTSDKLELALRQSDYYLIIHLDTDVFQTENVPQELQISMNGSVEEIVEKVRAKLIELMTQEFYEAHQTKIIFAIAVHSIECWLLPLYFTNDKKGKLVNALDTLNQELQKKEGFSIDSKNKNPQFYRLISEKYWKHKTLMKLYKENPSLKIFIEDLNARNIGIPKEEEDW